MTKTAGGVEHSVDIDRTSRSATSDLGLTICSDLSIPILWVKSVFRRGNPTTLLDSTT